MNPTATITVEQLKERLDAGETLHLIDVREHEEVAHGMIDGAIHMPLGQVPQRLDEIPRDEEVIFICRSGYRSDQACQYLSNLGFKGATNLVGGMLAWVNLP
ncbi:rhodanese-like domain-containing protein [Cohnella yongneupensis]|uniref:Rhodanese-like domain-containing protein n=1 Tax=Cohnella yongneupensis TaxID=425006 RepID=A0ABW0R644_9BACL